MENEAQLSKQQRLYLRKGRSETLLHILIKILAYCFFWDEKETLIIEPNYKLRSFKPDLVSFSSSEYPSRLEKYVSKWIECKKVTVKKLVKLSKILRRSKIYWFHTYSAFHGILKGNTMRKKINALINLKLVAIKIEKNALNQITLDLGRKNPIWILRWENKDLEISNGIWKECIKFIDIKNPIR
jgi:hypothetical protein